jgi:hypothetical protein
MGFGVSSVDLSGSVTTVSWLVRFFVKLKCTTREI